MRAWHRFVDWPLRAKMAALFVVASLLPLAVATWINIGEARERLLANTAAVLAARGDQLVGRLDTFNRGYQRAVDRVAHLPDVVAFFGAEPAQSQRLKPALSDLLNGWPTSDANIRRVALLDTSGVIQVVTDNRRIGTNLSYRPFIRQALQGYPVISDVYFADPAGDVPTIAFLAPVWGPGHHQLGVAAFW
jgi:C4-dicarboxylate-specific signal transduction histidine kinase